MTSPMRWRVCVILPFALGCSCLLPTMALAQGCKEDNYPKRAHMATPGFDEANLGKPDLVKAYLQRLCFDTTGMDGYLMYEKGSAVEATGEVRPEYGAMNISLTDLGAMGRVIARVAIVSPTKKGFPLRHYAEGNNYIFVGRAQAGYIPVWLIDDNGKTDLLPAGTYKFTENGHHPKDGAVVPDFTASIRDCQARSRRACFLDGPHASRVAAKIDSLRTTKSLSRSAALAVLSRTMDISDGTGTWILLNGLCFCQGNDCHQ